MGGFKVFRNAVRSISENWSPTWELLLTAPLSFVGGGGEAGKGIAANHAAGV
jgi:hypothetical protein